MLYEVRAAEASSGVKIKLLSFFYNSFERYPLSDKTRFIFKRFKFQIKKNQEIKEFIETYLCFLN